MENFQISQTKLKAIEDYIFFNGPKKLKMDYNYTTIADRLLYEFGYYEDDIDNYLNDQQQEYYDSLNKSDKKAYKNQIIEFIKENYSNRLLHIENYINNYLIHQQQKYLQSLNKSEKKAYMKLVLESIKYERSMKGV